MVLIVPKEDLSSYLQLHPRVLRTVQPQKHLQHPRVTKSSTYFIHDKSNAPGQGVGVLALKTPTDS